MDYDVSPDGENIVYSTYNALGGSDIWLTDRNGISQTRLISCGKERCFRLTFGQKNSVFAYVMENTENLEQRESYLILYDLKKKTQTDRLINIGSSVSSLSWSPDGSRLAFFDNEAQKLRIWNLTTDQETHIATNYDMAAAWFPASMTFLTGRVDMFKEGNPRVSLYVFDLNQGQVREWSVINAMNLDISQPVISPDGLWIALAGRPAGGSYAKQVWVFDIKGELIEEVTQEQNFTHASVRWSPSGTMLVYQRLEANASDSKPEIWVWDWEERAKQPIATDAAIPKWLP